MTVPFNTLRLLHTSTCKHMHTDICPDHTSYEWKRNMCKGFKQEGRTGTLQHLSWEVYLHDNRGCKTLRMCGEQTGVGTWVRRSDPTPKMKTKWMKDGMIKLEHGGHRGYSLVRWGFRKEREKEWVKIKTEENQEQVWGYTITVGDSVECVTSRRSSS